MASPVGFSTSSNSNGVQERQPSASNGQIGPQNESDKVISNIMQNIQLQKPSSSNDEASLKNKVEKQAAGSSSSASNAQTKRKDTDSSIEEPPQKKSKLEDPVETLDKLIELSTKNVEAYEKYHNEMAKIDQLTKELEVMIEKVKKNEGSESELNKLRDLIVVGKAVLEESIKNNTVLKKDSEEQEEILFQVLQQVSSSS